MNTLVRTAIVALLVATPAIAGAQEASTENGVTIINSSRCSVSDLPAFDAFIAGKPTPSQFAASYSCVKLVLPRDITTFERRFDKSRYFAQLDEHGRIVGGRFG